ncbi:hypothetical protein MBLNU230_g4583t1 [Neophaeotheca triangularis]
MPVAARFTKFLGRRASHAPHTQDSRETPPTSFLSLPPEIRNTIYALAAQDSRLDLWRPVRPFRPQVKRPPPGLTLVSKQVRSEYLPLFLATAPVTAYIHDFHFRPLIRLIGGLYAKELNALRANPHRDIVMLVNADAVAADYARSDMSAMDSLILPLRRWLAHRANSVDDLTWTYTMTLVNRNLNRRPPEFCYMKLSDLLRRLGERVTEALEWELDLICYAPMYTVSAEGEDELKFVSMGRRARAGGHKQAEITRALREQLSG